MILSIYNNHIWIVNPSSGRSTTPSIVSAYPQSYNFCIYDQYVSQKNIANISVTGAEKGYTLTSNRDNVLDIFIYDTLNFKNVACIKHLYFVKNKTPSPEIAKFIDFDEDNLTSTV